MAGCIRVRIDEPGHCREFGGCPYWLGLMGPAIALKLMALCIGVLQLPYDRQLHILGCNWCLVALNAPICSKSVGSQKVFCILWANRATNCKMLCVTLVALNELYRLGIGIKDLADDFPFWDTNAFGLKREFSTSALPWLIIQPFWMV